MGIRRITLAAFVAAAVLAVAVSAFAGLGSVQTVVSGGLPEDPALAVDPAGQTETAILFRDPTALKATTKPSWLTGTWSAPGIVTSTGVGDAPAIVWGSASNVLAAAQQASFAPCDPSGAIALLRSSDAGASYSATVIAHPTWIPRDPAIAFWNGVVYVAYARLHSDGPTTCGSTSEIAVATFLASSGASTGEFTVPIGTSATRVRRPAIVPTGQGQIVVAAHDLTGTHNDIATVACDAVSGTCAAPVVVAAGTASANAAPAIASSSGRVVVAWQAGDGAAAQVRSATSSNGGASFGQSIPLESGTSATSAPQLAATSLGRIDAVYLGDGGLHSVSSLPGGNAEQWSTPVVIPTSEADPLSRLSIATSSIVDPPAPAAKTLIAWATTGGELKLVPIVHGATPPVVTSGQSSTVAKGSSTALRIEAVDSDGDPLSYAVSTQPSSAGASASFADSARSTMTFKAGHVARTEQVGVTVTDVGGKTATGTIGVTVKNAPPEITCTTLFVAAGKDLPIDPLGCAEDPDGDALTFALSDASGGKLALADSGYTFTPLAGAKSSFLLKVSDDDTTVQARVNVAVLSTDSKVAIKITGGEGQRTVYAGAALRLRATGTDATGRSLPVSWDFGDGTSRSRGRSVTHAYARLGLWYVTASTTSTAARFRVRVYPRPFGLVGAIRFAGRSTVLVSLHCRAAGTVTARVLGAGSHVRRVMPAGAITRSLHVPTGALADKGTITIVVSFAPASAGPLPVPQLRRVVVVPASLRR